MQEKISSSLSDQIYFHRELLTYSLEERNVELITITGHNERCEEREENMQGLFPEFDATDEIMSRRFTTHRPFKFNKRIVFLSARVHPGEV